MNIVIDVGGSKVLVARFSDTNQLESSKKFETPQFYPDFITQLKTVITEVANKEQPNCCAIALPAVLDRENGIAISFGNLPWENVNIVADLSDVLSCPILLENDAKMAALSEAYEVKDLYNRVLYITVSTGIGIGLVDNGKIEHTVSDAGGRGIMLEHQGKIMAWEELASGKAIVAKTGKLASEITDEGDWYMVARNIAIGLIDLLVLLGPDCVIIGGGVGTHLEKFQEKLWNELEIYRSKLLTNMPQIHKAAHPEEAVVYGGAILCEQYLQTTR